MSFSIKKDIECVCGEIFESEIWSSINIKEDAYLQDTILSGELNVVKCPICCRYIYAETFMLYHDPDKEFLAYVYPKNNSANKDHWIKKMFNEFNQAQTGFEDKDKLKYEPIALFGLDELVDIIKDEIEQADEINVLKTLAKKANISMVRIKQSVARNEGIPFILPRRKVKNKTLRQQMIDGLKSAIEINDNLKHYNKLYKRVLNNPDILSGMTEKYPEASKGKSISKVKC